MISIGNIFKTNPAEFDEVWVICFAVDELRSLFEDFDNAFMFRNWRPKKACLKSIEVWFIQDCGTNKPLQNTMCRDF